MTKQRITCRIKNDLEKLAFVIGMNLDPEVVPDVLAKYFGLPGHKTFSAPDTTFFNVRLSILHNLEWVLAEQIDHDYQFEQIHDQIQNLYAWLS